MTPLNEVPVLAKGPEGFMRRVVAHTSKKLSMSILGREAKRSSFEE